MTLAVSRHNRVPSNLRAIWRTIGLVAVAGLALSAAACASLTQAPRPILPTEQVLAASKPYLLDPVGTYYKTPALQTAMTPVQWRDAVISNYMAAINARYEEFKGELSVQTTEVNLGVDLAALGLNAAAALASQGTANTLAAASAGVLGAGAAINKNVYFQKTLPALLAAMDTARGQVRLRIRASQQLDAVRYLLAAALNDLHDYESAGTMETAISQLTTIAVKASADTAAKIDFVGQTLTADALARLSKFNDFIRGKENAAGKPMLDAIAALWKIGSNADPETLGDLIIQEATRRVAADPGAKEQNAAMDKIATDTKSITKEDF